MTIIKDHKYSLKSLSDTLYKQTKFTTIKSTKLFTLLSLMCLASNSLSATTIVNFNASDINSVLIKGSDFSYNENSPTLNSTTLLDYAGAPIYGGFEEEGNAAWTASSPDNGGLKIRWNADQGTLGEAASALFLFAQDDFLNGANNQIMMMDSNNDTVNLTRLINGTSSGVESASVRLVIQDSSGYHISDPQSFDSGTLVLEATTLAYASYQPSIKTETEVGLIGSNSSPTFNAISKIGFRIDAIRGDSSGVNIGITEFQANATISNQDIVHNLTINSKNRYQKFEGFGASGAFYINRLANNTHASFLAELLFDDLGLDILRVRNNYQVGGSSSYQTNLDATFELIQLGLNTVDQPFKILMSSWSPPDDLKSNANFAGGTLASDSNGYRYDDFANWWLESLEYHEAQGVTVDYLSIQNEPNYETTYATCRFAPTETTSHAGYNQAFEKVWQKLADAKGTQAMPKMLGPEIIGFDNTVSGNTHTLEDYIDNLIHKDHVYGYAHHLYQGINGIGVDEDPDNLNSKMLSTNTNFDYKPLFQTEFADLNFESQVPSDWSRKSTLAKLIFNALSLEEVSAYFYWALYWFDNQTPQVGAQGLVTLPDNDSYIINPEYYAFKHYSAFIHADWRRVDISHTINDVYTSAFISPEQDAMTVVLLNQNTDAVNFEVQFGNLIPGTGTIYRSTADLNCVNSGTFDPNQNTELELVGESITTLTLSLTPPIAPAKPNVLFIAIDDLRPQLRTYGAAQMVTPNLDQLAQDGYQFNRAYVQEAICGPSRASIMSGLRPDTTRVYDLETDFRTTVPWVATLPMHFSENGYHSTGIGKIYHNGDNDAITWDVWQGDGSGKYSYADPVNISINNNNGSTNGPPTENYNTADNTYRDGAVTDTAIANLANLKNQQPFFYGVGYVRPHLPFVAPQSYWDLYSTADLEFPHTDNPATDASQYAYTQWNELRTYDGIPESGPVSSEQEEALIHGYYACVSYVDAQVGRLLEGLEANGLDENTIIIVWGDHGWHLGDHGEWCKHTNFELATRIPLIVKVPWMPGASKIDALVEALDIYPTLADLCGLEIPDHVEGDSLRPLIESPDSLGDAQALSQYPRYGDRMGYSLRTDRYRYNQWFDSLGNIIDEELYDHFLDPKEDVNVAGQASYSSVITSLDIQMTNYLNTINPPSNATTDFGQYLINSNLSGEDALSLSDSDGDGASNLLEYATNLNPAQNDIQTLTLNNGTEGMPTVYFDSTENGRLELEYLRRVSVDDLLYFPEFSNSLDTPTWEATFEETVTPINSDWERVRVRDSIDANTQIKRFGRVRVQHNP